MVQSGGTKHRVAVVLAGGGMPFAADVFIERTGLVVLAADGRSDRLAFSETRLEAGGLNGQFVCCVGPRFTVQSEDPAFAAALHKTGERRIEDGLRAIEAERARGQRNLKLGVAFCLCVLGLFILAVISIPRMLASAVPYLPTAVDTQLGDLGQLQLSELGPESEDEALRTLIGQLLEDLSKTLPANDYDFRLTAIESEDVNAFALPGGRMVVLTGLIGYAESIDEVAGIIAHELVHVLHRHGVRNVAHSLGLGALFGLVVGDIGGASNLGATILEGMIANGYSRTQELEADLEGARYVAAAGYDPHALAKFFERMERDASTAERFANFLGDHPENLARVEAIRSRTKHVVRAPSEVDLAFAEIRMRYLEGGGR